MKRTVEIFTAGCPVCDPVVQLIKETACDSCDVIYKLFYQWIRQNIYFISR